MFISWNIDISQPARSKTLHSLFSFSSCLKSLFSFSSRLKSAGNRSLDTHIVPYCFQYYRKPLARTYRTAYTTLGTRVLKHSWVLKAQSFVREVRRSASCMLSLSGCSCFIDDNNNNNNNNTSSVAVLLSEVWGKLQVSCQFVRSHCYCHCLGSR